MILSFWGHVALASFSGSRGILLLWRDRAMPGYYTERLAAERLRACYDLAPPRTKAYLEAEIEFVLAKTKSSMLALELGCGYGRVLERILPRVSHGWGFPQSFFLRRGIPLLGQPDFRRRLRRFSIRVLRPLLVQCLGLTVSTLFSPCR